MQYTFAVDDGCYHLITIRLKTNYSAAHSLWWWWWWDLKKVFNNVRGVIIQRDEVAEVLMAN